MRLRNDEVEEVERTRSVVGEGSKKRYEARERFVLPGIGESDVR